MPVNDPLLPGIRRRRGRHGYIYCRPDGSLLCNEEELRRIGQHRLGIHPAWHTWKLAS